ncbi:hypothetical protein ABZT49_19795 [Methylobacterium sp. EM32]|uniref:hypothetical protein n=1 Tax=Methylobacterium TaxID=407 RepID=UPI0019323118|nr:hypothetical protein [Methylobacterium aquaticum]QRE76758.1 hypothetical protein F1D61_27275 [Methylobacterium aquaticum]
MTAINLVAAICSAPNAVALMRAIDRAVPGNAIRVKRYRSTKIWDATDGGYPLIGPCGFRDLKFRLARICHEGQDVWHTKGLYLDPECRNLIDGDSSLPSTFYWPRVSEVRRYSHMGHKIYMVSGSRENTAWGRWWFDYLSVQINDDVTASRFLKARVTD